MKNILYILFAVFAVSCETILTDVPVPEVPTQAVVFANLSPLNNFSRIELTKSKPVINSSPSNEFDAIVDADVKVTVGATEYTFTYDAPNNAYFHSGNIPFASGDVCSFLASILISQPGFSFSAVFCAMTESNTVGKRVQARC